MEKIESETLIPSCNCEPSCVYNLYSLSKEDVTLERSAPKVYEYGVHKGDNEYGHFGTDPLDGFDFSTSYFYNMGKIFREATKNDKKT